MSSLPDQPGVSTLRQRAGVSVLWARLLSGLALFALAFGVSADQAKLDPWLLNREGVQPVLVEFHDPTPLRVPMRAAGERVAEHRSRLIDHWRERAAQSQVAVRAELDAAGIAHRSFWIINALAVNADPVLQARLASLPQVRHVYADRSLRLSPPAPKSDTPRLPQAVEWGVERIRAPEVWAAGITGQGTVIAGQDTGIRWDHQALINQYRGWDGSSVDHTYHWHDAIHELYSLGSNPCGLSSPVPCDDHNHGTHTIGTAVGDDGGANQIGVAPGAKWIGCRNMERGDGRPSTYTECFEWLVAPTDANGQHPRPDLAPDVINNSWGCPPSEGCTTPLILEQVVQNVRAAGIVVVVSAGNSGPSCATITAPPAFYDASFTVGSTTASEQMSSFSSRGPVAAGIGSQIKPDVVAPGSSVRSATRASTSSYGTSSGTSMAGPHVAGTVALLIATDPGLRGNVDRIEQILRETAVAVSHSQTCGGLGPDVVPNHVSGHGRIDAWAAFRVAETILVDDFEP